ncbi:MAG TPA: hypothetical protein VKU62_05600 [Thermoanaerobaculia bacterium]|nr:hypothetical protein [Thermoanaerobaculia bacterium]
MKRVVVLGSTGFFGGVILDRLRAAGLQPLGASRSSAEMRVDANNPDDIRKNLKARDLVIDAAGPFQTRTPALIDGAMRIGFDIIDLSDSPEYTQLIYDRAAPIGAAGIRVLPACSTLSTMTAIVVQSAPIEKPGRVTVYLRPESRLTANRGAIESFLRSIESAVRGGLRVKTVDAVTLPRIFPSLKRIEFVVDAGFAGNLVLQFDWMRQKIAKHVDRAVKMGRRFGNSRGRVRFEIASLLHTRSQTFAGRNSYMLAVLPAVLAATAIVNGKFPHRGIVPHTQHVTREELFEAIRAEGIEITA